MEEWPAQYYGGTRADLYDIAGIVQIPTRVGFMYLALFVAAIRQCARQWCLMLLAAASWVGRCRSVCTGKLCSMLSIWPSPNVVPKIPSTIPIMVRNIHRLPLVSAYLQQAIQDKKARDQRYFEIAVGLALLLRLRTIGGREHRVFSLCQSLTTGQRPQRPLIQVQLSLFWDTVSVGCRPSANDRQMPTRQAVCRCSRLLNHGTQSQA